MKTRLTYLMVFLFIALSAVGQKKKVAVFDPTGLNDDAAIQIAREMIIDRLISSTVYIVLEREKINQVLKENAYQLGGHVDEGQISDLGKQMGADFVCVSTVQSLRGTYFFSTRLVDVITAQAYASGVGRSEDIFVAIEVAASKLVGSSEDITIKLSATVEPGGSRKEATTATQEIVIKKTSGSPNKTISIITGGSALKSNLAGLASGCKKSLSTQYNVLETYPDGFTVKGSVNSWSANNNADFIINLGQNIGRKIVINIYVRSTNNYEYIYTDISPDSEGALQSIVDKIVAFVEK
jgi:translation initiation factor 1 (eIF-1/SUI1)